MIKNQKGVTISMLAVTIIILVILAGITISTGSNLIRSSKLRNYITTMNLIKLEVEKIAEQFEFENFDSSTIESYYDVSNAMKIEQDVMINSLTYLTESEKNMIISPTSEMFNSIPVEDLWFKWYGPILDDLKIEYTNMFDADDDASEIYFYINYATGEVIYPKGYRASDGTITYSLSGLSKISE